MIFTALYYKFIYIEILFYIYINIFHIIFKLIIIVSFWPVDGDLWRTYQKENFTVSQRSSVCKNRLLYCASRVVELQYRSSTYL